MNKKQEKMFEDIFSKKFKEVQLGSIKSGAEGILKIIYEMCKEGKTVEDIKQLCERNLK